MDRHILNTVKADGLGDKITVTGLSLGGVMSAYAAQFRPDVDRAVVISPRHTAARGSHRRYHVGIR